MTKLTTLIASAFLLVAPFAAHAADCGTSNRTPDGKICFKGSDNATWIITDGGNGADVSKLYMSADAGIACPGHRVILEPTTKAPALTKAQNFRGDKPWHIVCDRRPVTEVQAAVPPVVAAPLAATPQNGIVTPVPAPAPRIVEVPRRRPNYIEAIHIEGEEKI